MKFDYDICLFQSFIALLTAILASVELRKEFRKRTEIAKKEAKIIFSLIIIFALSSIILVWVQASSSFDDKIKLQSNFDTLKLKNDLLEKQIIADNKILSQRIKESKDTLLYIAADKALKASIQLDKKAKEIETAIFGGDEYIYIICYQREYNKFSPIILNKTNFPQYDVGFVSYDYDGFLKCGTIKKGEKTFLDYECIEKFKTALSSFPVYAQRERIIPEMDFGYIGKPRKFYFYIYTRSLSYIEEYYLCGQGDAFRLFKLEKNKEKKILKVYNPDKININWVTEFEISPDQELLPFPK
jgi:hypothetical protein